MRKSFAWFVLQTALLLVMGAAGGSYANERTDTASPAIAPFDAIKQFVLSPALKATIAGQVLPGVVTSKTISSTHLTPPSLWWIADQLASEEQYGNKFIQEWVAYPVQSGKPGRLDLLVNRQQWSLLDYLQRYQFVHRFGAVARAYGYNTRIYDNPDSLPVALLVCDFSTAAMRSLPLSVANANATGGSFQPSAQTNAVDDVMCQLKVDTFLRSPRERLLERVRGD